MNTHNTPNLISAQLWKTKRRDGSLSGEGLYKVHTSSNVKVFADPDTGLPSIRMTISDGTRDRDQDTVNPRGWNLDWYKKNPVVLWAHSHDTPPLGQSTKIECVGGKLVAEARFDVDIADYSFPRTVVELLKRGTLRAASVGFIPTKYVESKAVEGGVDFTEQELLEWSIVPVPSNRNALLEARSAGVDISPIVDWAGEVLDQYGGDRSARLMAPRKTLEEIASIGKRTISTPSANATRETVERREMTVDEVEKLFFSLVEQLAPRLATLDFSDLQTAKVVAEQLRKNVFAGERYQVQHAFEKWLEFRRIRGRDRSDQEFRHRLELKRLIAKQIPWRPVREG